VTLLLSMVLGTLQEIEMQLIAIKFYK